MRQRVRVNHPSRSGNGGRIAVAHCGKWVVPMVEPRVAILSHVGQWQQWASKILVDIMRIIGLIRCQRE